METNHTHDDEEAGLRTDTTLPFGLIRLEEAATRLGVSRQGIVNLLEQSGVGIRRIQAEGRNVSAVDELDLERIRPAAGVSPTLHARLQSAAPVSFLELAETRDLLRQTQVELAEARADLKLAESSIEQLERVTSEAGEAQNQIVELTRTIGGLDANLQTARAEIVKRDDELAFLRNEFREERERLSAEVAGERDRWATVREDLEGTRSVKDALARQLKLSEQVEAANYLYLDRVEEKLDAARHTAQFLRRKGA
jgi:DNA repair exonuclease SbcCD ATPase subunit